MKTAAKKRKAAEDKRKEKGEGDLERGGERDITTGRGALSCSEKIMNHE